VKRRDFITLLARTKAASPLAARAQQDERIRRVGLLMGYTENDPGVQSFFAAFRSALAKLGWTDGSNLPIELRWGAAEKFMNSGIARNICIFIATLRILAKQGIISPRRFSTKRIRDRWRRE
jgi:putative ABC transport system substrate-binding protein